MRLSRLLIPLLSLLAALPLQARERVLSMHADIEVSRTGEVLVTETISIVAEGKRFRHGITRVLPQGENMTDALEIISLERDGRPEEYRRSAADAGIRIHVGKKADVLAPGEYTYKLTYRVGSQILQAGEEDVFNWNVTGRWDVPIEQASATARLPKGVRVLSIRSYAGMPETTNRDLSVTERAGALTFATLQRLEPEERLSFEIVLPRDAIQPPPRN